VGPRGGLYAVEQRKGPVPLPENKPRPSNPVTIPSELSRNEFTNKKHILVIVNKINLQIRSHKTHPSHC
jgi:hypothetical protein